MVSYTQQPCDEEWLNNQSVKHAPLLYGIIMPLAFRNITSICISFISRFVIWKKCDPRGRPLVRVGSAPPLPEEPPTPWHGRRQGRRRRLHASVSYSVSGSSFRIDLTCLAFIRWRSRSFFPGFCTSAGTRGGLSLSLAHPSRPFLLPFLSSI